MASRKEELQVLIRYYEQQLVVLRQELALVDSGNNNNNNNNNNTNTNNNNNNNNNNSVSSNSSINSNSTSNSHSYGEVVRHYLPR